MSLIMPSFKALATSGSVLPDIELYPLQWSVQGEPITVRFPGPGFVAIGMVYFGGGTVPIFTGVSIDGVTVPNVTSSGGSNAGTGLFATMITEGGNKDIEWTGGTSNLYNGYCVYTPLVTSATAVATATSTTPLVGMGTEPAFLFGAAYDTTQAAGGNAFTGAFTDTVDISLCDFGYSYPLAVPTGGIIQVGHSGFRSLSIGAFR
jgi:hypothetical protein